MSFMVEDVSLGKIVFCDVSFSWVSPHEKTRRVLRNVRDLGRSLGLLSLIVLFRRRRVLLFWFGGTISRIILRLGVGLSQAFWWEGRFLRVGLRSSRLAGFSSL